MNSEGGENPGFAGWGNEMDKRLEEISALVRLKSEQINRELESLRLIGRSEAASLLSLSERSIDRLRKGGQLAWVDIDRYPRFKLSDVQEFIESRKKYGCPPRKTKKREQ